jgi:hypothetical protein
MIFPDLPKRPEFWNPPPIEPPAIVQEAQPKKINAEEWWIAHGLAPESQQTVSLRSGPIDWFGRDAWEFYFLCAGMIAWIAYWYGVHRGAW